MKILKMHYTEPATGEEKVFFLCLCGYRFDPTHNSEDVNDNCPICPDDAGILMREIGE